MAQISAGPLSGVRVVELGGIGPVPFAGMTLADLGAEVIRIDRPGGEGMSLVNGRFDLLSRGKRSVVLNLKDPADVAAARAVIASADVLIEGWRPGVAERLGLGPEDCHQVRPGLVYGRMTGWGQHGERSQQAGHDINYLALTGALHAIGAEGLPPQIPLNLLGDFGGGAVYLVMGVLAALLEARQTGVGRVVDAAIVDGAAHLLAPIFGLLAAGVWTDARGVNLLDGGAPFYAVYETADGRHMAVGSLEPQFFAQLVAGTGVTVSPGGQHDQSAWLDLRSQLTAVFKGRTMQHWREVFDGTDACVVPVLTMAEAAVDDHLASRETFVSGDGVPQPGPAPRFLPAPARAPAPIFTLGADTADVLREVGVVGGAG